MQSLPNIEKSAFRRFEYVGYAGGKVYRVRKTGYGGWEAWAGEPGYGSPFMTAPTLAALSDKLAKL
jgi:hypothetical protein